MSAYFVTATGTDIGKTFVASGLLRHLRAQRKVVAGIKPVISGFDIAKARASDTGELLDAMGEAVTPEAVEQISPWRFIAPLSPDMAAAREGKSIDFDALVAFCRDAAAWPGTLLIEGVGGVMVPLDAGHTVLDWMAALGLPAVLVTGSYLGTISHTLTAARVMAQAGVKIAALVLNDSGDGAVPLDDTVASLRRFLPETPLVVLPRGAGEADFGRLADELFQRDSKNTP
ncbi:MAG: dethiobiotin synthase [Alphaproteobacteria bacterium]|nr:dethiobiotin synthase [Alphaproteobacteria bacterium]MDE1986479.1 dethiobiotin synthase [Alphaproteobacteria bacterium]MDE2163584.1 dethiobiotin synthase [Alphaproteobacteria bacterium]MDE2501279.1 dethiobiotin synthase [Alphaproteobacteria bacterium]